MNGTHAVAVCVIRTSPFAATSIVSGIMRPSHDWGQAVALAGSHGYADAPHTQRTPRHPPVHADSPVASRNIPLRSSRPEISSPRPPSVGPAHRPCGRYHRNICSAPAPIHTTSPARSRPQRRPKYQPYEQHERLLSSTSRS